MGKFQDALEGFQVAIKQDPGNEEFILASKACEQMAKLAEVNSFINIVLLLLGTNYILYFYTCVCLHFRYEQNVKIPPIC